MIPSLTLDELPLSDIDRVMLPISLRLMPSQELAHGGNAGLDKPHNVASSCGPSYSISGVPLSLCSQELAHGGNAGLDKPVSWLEPVHSKHPDVSYADLYTLAGV